MYLVGLPGVVTRELVRASKKDNREQHGGRHEHA